MPFAASSDWICVTICSSTWDRSWRSIPIRRPPAAGNPLAPIIAAFTGLTLTIQVRDEAALGKQLDVLISGINQVLAQRPPGGAADAPQFRKKAGRAPSMCWSSLRARFPTVLSACCHQPSRWIRNN